MEFELYKGLPLRTINTTNDDGKDVIFGVTTETVNTLISNYLENNQCDGNSDIEFAFIEEFDNSFMYAVPDDIFLNKDADELIEYINTNII